MNRLSSRTTQPASVRTGVTLVEVLMSLMVMGIGVASVAVLFPISMLRSIEATKLTNGAITKLNLETVLDVHPELIFDPDGDGDLTEHFQSAAARNYIVDPVGYYTTMEQGRILGDEDYRAFAAIFGNVDLYNGSGPPTIAGTLQRFGGGLTATDGTTIETSLNTTPPPTPADLPLASPPSITDYSTTEYAAMRQMALELANQGDGWETQVDTMGGTFTATTPGGRIPLASTADLSAVPTSQLTLPSDGSGGFLAEDPEFYRIVVFSLDGTFSQAYPLLHLDNAAKVAYITEDLDDDDAYDPGEDFNMNGVLDQRTLPMEFRIDLDSDGVLEVGEEVVSRVLLQSRKVTDFSWLLTVRRRGDGLVRGVDVVVRFNDGVDRTDERLFEATFLPGTRTVGVRLPGGFPDLPIKKGKFIFDATNAIWYRIEDVQRRPEEITTGTPWGTYEYVVTVESDISNSAGAGADSTNGLLDGDDTTSFGAAMFPKSVVDVYPLGSRNIPDDLLELGF